MDYPRPRPGHHGEALPGTRYDTLQCGDTCRTGRLWRLSSYDCVKLQTVHYSTLARLRGK